MKLTPINMAVLQYPRWYVTDELNLGRNGKVSGRKSLYTGLGLKSEV